MLSLMLNPRFKSLRLVSSFIGHEQVVIIIEGYDRIYIYNAFGMLSSFKSGGEISRWHYKPRIDEDYNMDIL